MDTAGNKYKQSQNPRVKANIFEILTFSWMLNLFNTGKKRDLDINDLYTTLNDHTSSSLGNALEKKWRTELFNANTAKRNPSLMRTLIQMFGLKIMAYGLVLSLGENVLKMSQPLFIGRLLAYFNPEGSNKIDLVHAYIYAFCLTFCMLTSMLINHGAQVEMGHIGMKIRVACCSTIYRKVLRLSNTGLGEATVGQTVNLLSNDVSRFDTAFFYLHYLWMSPLQAVVVTFFLWQEIGVSSILGVATLIMIIPLQGWLGKKTYEFRLKTAIRTDARVCLMNEIFSGIQVIKMYTWEKPFAYLVQYARKCEIKQIRGTAYIKAILVSFQTFNMKIAMFLTIFSYVLLGNYISAQKVFTMAAYYGQLRTSMSTLFPQSIGQMAELIITIKRIQNFLLYEEKENQIENLSKLSIVQTDSIKKFNINNSNFISNNVKNNGEVLELTDFGIVVSNASAKWTDTQMDNSLENINLIVRPGRLVAIIGPVGAGKSSLIQAILRELPLYKGKISVRGIVSYASQEPWLFSGSVQKNILFGLPMDKERYNKVINACALKTDFKQFPYGDRTIVGEKGISLSGGQKARINLARAVYKQADIYLLDDPLSAVDTHVGRHLFDKCIKGFLKEKTCVIVTHQIQYLTNVDQIILMENANVLTEGTYKELQSSNFDFTKLLKSSVGKLVVCDNELNIRNESNNDVDSNSIYDRRVSVISFESIDDNKFIADHMEPLETHSSGKIAHSVYSSYFSAGGKSCKILFFIFICVLTQILISVSDLWISYWVNKEEHVFHNAKIVYTSKKEDLFMGMSISRQTCVNVFTGLIVIMIVTTAVRSVTFVSVCMRASTNLHNNLFNSVIRATMNFFSTNPSGRILNRFSKDIGTVDELIPDALMTCIHYGLTLIGIIVVVGIINVYLMIPTIILAFIFYKITIFYLSSSRSIKRLDGITRSPVFSHLNASLQGLTTIRAFEAEKILTNEFDHLQDLHSSAWYIFLTSSRAFGVWLDFICLLYICIITFSFIVIDTGTYGGNVGLAISQAFSLIGMFQYGIRQTAELENYMTSVERVLEYSNIQQEAALELSTDKKSPILWPSKGQITFKNFYMRYTLDKPYIIKNLNINIESMQKIGIVGRTGAGKSSLIGSLFRLALNEGIITIDNIEIHELGLHTLRSKLSIIPQEPVLFSGTMRKNLDPFDEYSDHILWNVLDEVELKDTVEDLPNGLNSKMSEGGSNFSVGQRQLVCLARAILRNNKILILDEATANVDLQTDALIQNTIRNKFRTCTVLTIAHRLNTIMDSDKVLVMDAGAMVEFDHPHNLLKNKDGFLFKMAEQTGRVSADLLHRMAAESYKSMMMSIESTKHEIDKKTENV